MKHERNRGADKAAINRIIERLEVIVRSGPPADGDRTTVQAEILAMRPEIIAAYGIRPRYQRHFRRLAQLWRQNVLPTYRARWSDIGAADEWWDFATVSALLMQNIEHKYGVLANSVRWSIYEAFAQIAKCSHATEEGNDDAQRRLKSHDLNAIKRTKRRGGVSLDERDTAIVAEWQSLKKEMPGKGQRDQQLATKYGLDPRSIYNITHKAGLRGKSPETPAGVSGNRSR